MPFVVDQYCSESVESIIAAIQKLPEVRVDENVKPCTDKSITVLQSENVLFDLASQKIDSVGTMSLATCVFLIFKIKFNDGKTWVLASHADQREGYHWREHFTRTGVQEIEVSIMGGKPNLSGGQNLELKKVIGHLLQIARKDKLRFHFTQQCIQSNFIAKSEHRLSDFRQRILFKLSRMYQRLFNTALPDELLELKFPRSAMRKKIVLDKLSERLFLLADFIMLANATEQSLVERLNINRIEFATSPEHLTHCVKELFTEEGYAAVYVLLDKLGAATGAKFQNFQFNLNNGTVYPTFNNIPEGEFTLERRIAIFSQGHDYRLAYNQDRYIQPAEDIPPAFKQISEKFLPLDKGIDAKTIFNALSHIYEDPKKLPSVLINQSCWLLHEYAKETLKAKKIQYNRHGLFLIKHWEDPPIENRAVCRNRQ